MHNTYQTTCNRPEIAQYVHIDIKTRTLSQTYIHLLNKPNDVQLHFISTIKFSNRAPTHVDIGNAHQGQQLLAVFVVLPRDAD